MSGLNQTNGENQIWLEPDPFSQNGGPKTYKDRMSTC